MDKYKVKVNPRAISELDRIYKYIADDKLSPQNARGQVDRIKKAVLNLDAIFRVDEPNKTVYVVTIQYQGRNL